MLKQFMRMVGIGLCAAGLLGATECQSNANGVGPDGPNFVTTLAVQDANGNAISTFSSGQQIQLVLSVRNRSTTAQTVIFNTAQQANFAVFDGGSATEVWTWSLGQSFDQSQTSLTWQSGETKTFTVTWDQMDDGNQLLAPGNYEAVAGLACVSGDSSSSSSSAATSCMPTGAPGAGNLTPSVYISTLVPFTIQ